ncbi:DNA polymerase beta domain protein region [Sulfolobus islandicus Y.G.57.14]|uniref:DNA polymerase beta domain protein region n=8 Tax=Saccharolobus islandicus TaxID=43080 RepID=C3MKX4_SACI2|nr:nucleotidyltransferase domain-containing protein [Sulfolobus islandicus]ACP34499.1 DNA polymerase beta domain protein region [Sulfolobus islandicus L.S.2.15]ACP37212.1 DNA polymerase beta domain protein region [Sulfolobus islandicus M.14.25]ACP44623.1 DNA polymerase beta domain protein region [Sulfolobus islandicus Y.G.57.14]ACP49634.1 DNA polymerase beta domain protein region [Sulfolobus islandicus Y.N.15.51]ACP54351.1 DNA polymerase beta domain protein region [Sulfolobus islandicus M.16.2
MLEELCKIYSKFNPKLVILFGSYARGDYTSESDIDVLVVSDIFSRDPRESFGMAYNLKFPQVMPVAMNTQVFLKKLDEGSTFILEIIEDGKILCGEKEFEREVLERYKKIRKRFRRKGRLWEW